jgi:hypothetical protein
MGSPEKKEYKGHVLMIYFGQYDSSPHFYFADCQIMRDDQRIHSIDPSTVDPVLIGQPLQPPTADEAIARLKSEVEQEACDYVDSLEHA